MSDTSPKQFLTTRAAVVELTATMSFALAAMMKMQTSIAVIEQIELRKQLGDQAAVKEAIEKLRLHGDEGTKFLDTAVKRLTDILEQLGETNG